MGRYGDELGAVRGPLGTFPSGNVAYPVDGQSRCQAPADLCPVGLESKVTTEALRLLTSSCVQYPYSVVPGIDCFQSWEHNAAQMAACGGHPALAAATEGGSP
jgi:hypothetical protein